MNLTPFLRPQVGRVAGLFADLAVFDDVLVVELGRVAVGLGDPGRKAFRRREIRAQMPLARKAADVAGALQHFTQRRELLRACCTPAAPS